jgi:hypothetical protein
LVVAIAAAVTLTSCTPDVKRTTVALRPDLEHGEKFVCEPTGSRPTIPPEYVIDWTKVATVDQAHAEHDKFVKVLRDREGTISGYILEIESKHFVCWSNMTWQRDYYRGLDPSAKPPSAAPAPRHTSDATPVRVIGPVDLPGTPRALIAFRS